MNTDGDRNLLNILAAYPVNNSIISTINENKDRVRFLLDSGAFSAYTIGKEIKLDDYCRYIERLPFKPWHYFMLDIIGNPDKTRRNYEIMLDRGFKPIPVFQYGEDFSVIDDYYKTSEIIGIGGIAAGLANMQYIRKVMKYLNGRKCHWLGFTNSKYMNYYRPYSQNPAPLVGTLA